jgi:hypothetical protein
METKESVDIYISQQRYLPPTQQSEEICLDGTAVASYFHAQFVDSDEFITIETITDKKNLSISLKDAWIGACALAERWNDEEHVLNVIQNPAIWIGNPSKARLKKTEGFQLLFREVFPLPHSAAVKIHTR